MKNILKQSEGWVTPSNQNSYKKAVIQLTTYYAVGVFVILGIFNILVYTLFTDSIRSENNEHLVNNGEDDDWEYINKIGEADIIQIEDDLAKNLLISDALILLFTIIVSYIISKRTLKPLEESHKKQSVFVADVAHELRTPLSVMQAGSEVMLRSDRSASEYKKFIQESLDEVRRLTTLSNDLLFLVRNNKKRPDSIEAVNLSLLCMKQISIMNAYAEAKKVLIINNIEDGVSLNSKRDDLIRLVVNLLKNAVDYNKIHGEVSVILKKKNNKAILTVSDTGIGIEKSNLPYIFERFYKADNSRAQNSSSTGLGLAIVKEIVNEHKGTIKVTSDKNIGTTFEVVFPC